MRMQLLPLSLLASVALASHGLQARHNHGDQPESDGVAPTGNHAKPTASITLSHEGGGQGGHEDDGEYESTSTRTRTTLKVKTIYSPSASAPSASAEPSHHRKPIKACPAPVRVTVTVTEDGDYPAPTGGAPQVKAANEAGNVPDLPAAPGWNGHGHGHHGGGGHGHGGHHHRHSSSWAPPVEASPTVSYEAPDPSWTPDWNSWAPQPTTMSTSVVEPAASWPADDPPASSTTVAPEFVAPAPSSTTDDVTSTVISVVVVEPVPASSAPAARFRGRI